MLKPYLITCVFCLSIIFLVLNYGCAKGRDFSFSFTDEEGVTTKIQKEGDCLEGMGFDRELKLCIDER